MNFTRRAAIAALSAAAAFPARAVEAARPDLGYLEALGQGDGPNLGSSYGAGYLPPSRIDPAYSHAIYVNTALSGPGAQKMWVIERQSAGWGLALWDPEFWAEKGVTGTPPYSWPVSTGRKYPGDSRSGPTPVGVFNLDDRGHRNRPGWGSQGMYNSIYIDLHYSSGRASGVAIHGTTDNKYRLLGRADSHGCVRMRKANSTKVWEMVHGGPRAGGADAPLWGEVPRYFTSAPRADWSARHGYRRDGARIADASGAPLTKPGYTALFVFFRDDL